MKTDFKIGYLHLRSPAEHESGVTRYGRLLHQEMLEQQGPEQVQEASLTFKKNLCGQMSWQSSELKQALIELADCDVLHLQYSKYWGLRGWKKLQLLQTIRQGFSGKLCITLHDVYAYLYPAYGLNKAWEFEYKRFKGEARNPLITVAQTLSFLWNDYLADQATMDWILNNVDFPLVCNQAEADRLRHFESSQSLNVVPHFVENRQPVLTVPEAKATLGLGNATVLTLQGFIYQSKGHDLLLDALSQLPKSIHVVFAGGAAPGQQSVLQGLEMQIDRLGLGDRVHITGYLSEAELELQLAASDLAVCPFEVISASGSLCTWISVGRPILAYHLPQIQELNERVPGAIATFESYHPKSLAEAIKTCLQEQQAQQAANGASSSLQELQEQLSLTSVTKMHTQLFNSSQACPTTPSVSTLQTSLTPSTN